MGDQLPQERIGCANEELARAEAMFELTRDWVRERKAFGRRVADLQTVQHKLAELKTSIAVCRAFVDQCMERWRAWPSTGALTWRTRLLGTACRCTGGGAS